MLYAYAFNLDFIFITTGIILWSSCRLADKVDQTLLASLL